MTTEHDRSRPDAAPAPRTVEDTAEEGTAAEDTPVDHDPLDTPGALRALLASTSDALVLTAQHGEIRWASPSLHRVLGHAPDAVVGHDLFSFVHADDIQHAAQSFRQLVAGDPSRTPIVVRALQADGGWRWVEVVGSGLDDDPELGDAVVLSIRDVSERKATEEKLRSSEEWFRALVQHSTEGFVTIGPGTTVTYASPSITPILGYTPSELEGRNGLELLHPDDRDAMAKRLVGILAQPDHVVREEVRILHPSGETRWIEAGAVNLLGNPDIGGIVVTFRDVNDRRQAQDAVRNSEEHFRSLVQNSSDVVLIINEDIEVTYVSPSIEHVFGFEQEEVLGTIGLEFMHPDDVHIAVEGLEGVLATPEVPRVSEVRARHADGSWRWIEAHVVNLLDDPDVGGIVATMRDITDRRRTDVALRESEARFRAVVQNSRDVTGILDAAGEVMWGSPKVERMLGWTVDELLGTSAFDLVHADDLEEATIEFAQTLGGDYEMHPLPLRLRHKNGSLVPVEILATDIRSDLDVPEGIVINIREATWRSEAEEALRKSEERFRALVQNSSDGVVVVSPEGRVTFASPAMERLFGRTSEQMAGTNGLDLVHPDDREMVATELAMLLEHAGQSTVREFRISNAEAEWRWIESTAVNMLDNDAVGGIVANIRDISERKAFEQQLEHAASHDPLTGLPNRTLLLDRLSQALARAKRSGRAVGILFLDLDNFKLVNDTHGHSFGDIALVAVANRLAQAIRTGDTVSRFGGDEFVVLCEDLHNIDEALEIAERLQFQITGPMTVEGREVFVETSIGVSVTAEPGTTPEHLIRDADAAMYHAKERGHGHVEVFDRDVRATTIDRIDLENALHRVIERDELVVHYQPIIDLTDDSISGVEALVRWQHPERGLLLPGTFMAVAEETGLMVPIGTWVLEKACRQVWDWNHKRDLAVPLHVSVNLSGRQLDDPGLIDEVDRIITVSGVEAGQVHLEITESLLMADVENTATTLEALGKLGVHLTVDDFGTGYSSLSYLRRFPVDQLKVDASFVDDMEGNEGNTAIVGAIIRLAHTLGLEAVAEGVENESQLAELRRLGCGRAQGFHLVRPAAADVIAELLRQ